MRRVKDIRSVALRYGLTLASFAIIVGAAEGLNKFSSLGRYLLALLIGLLVASAWYAGRGPGLMVAVLFELTLNLINRIPSVPVLAVVVAIAARVSLFVSVVWFASSRKSAENELRRQRE